MIQEVLVLLSVLVDAHSHNPDARSRKLLLKPVQGWNLLDAGRAPGGPEVQDQYFAAKGRWGNGVSSIGSDCEIRSRSALLCRGIPQTIGNYADKGRDQDEEQDTKR